MNCEQFQDRLDDCLDLRQDPTDDRHLNDHAGHCQRCHQILQIWQAANLCFNTPAACTADASSNQTVTLATQPTRNRQRTLLACAAAILLIALLPQANRVWSPAGTTMTASVPPDTLDQATLDQATPEQITAAGTPAPNDHSAGNHGYTPVQTMSGQTFAGHHPTRNLQLTDPHWWNGSLQEGRQWVDQALPTVQPAVDSMGERVATIGRRFKRLMASILLPPDQQPKQESPHATGRVPYSPHRRPLFLGDELNHRFVA